MNPFNILVLFNLLATFFANASSAKKEFKNKLTEYHKKPKTYLQKAPLNIAALILILTLLGVFGIFNLDESEFEFLKYVQLIGLGLYYCFSWLQIHCMKKLKNNYSQDIRIHKKHELVNSGIYKYIRHPQYLSQILSDLGAGMALLNFAIIPITLFVELPLLILRAKKEDQLLAEHFDTEFTEYKKKSGFIFPFIG